MLKYYYLINIYDFTIKTCREATPEGLKEIKKELSEQDLSLNYTIALTINE